MTAFEELIQLCKCNVTVEVNEHRRKGVKVSEHLAEYGEHGTIAEDLEVSDGIARAMHERDTLIVVQAYPNTPIGFEWAAHYDLDAACRAVLAKLKGTT